MPYNLEQKFVKQMLNAIEVAERLGISYRTVYRIVEKGLVEPIIDHGAYRFSSKHLKVMERIIRQRKLSGIRYKNEVSDK